MADAVYNTEDIIDSRDVIARIEELESDIEGYEEDIETKEREVSDLENEVDDNIREIASLASQRDALSEDDEDADERDQLDADIEDLEDENENKEIEIADLQREIENLEEEKDYAEGELKPLVDLQDQCNYGDWSYGATLIADSYFEEYAQDLASDIGAIDPNIDWPYTCIDWEKAASELQQDYTLVNFDGEDYWIRS